MKEGYLQRKIAEFSEEIQGFHRTIHMQQEELNRLEERVRGHKELIKRLDELDAFKESLRKEMKKEQKDLIDHMQERIEEETSRKITRIIKEEVSVLDEAVKQSREQKDIFESYTKTIQTAEANTAFLQEFFHLLLLKLINKGVLSVREKEEIERRSLKRNKQ